MYIFNLHVLGQISVLYKYTSNSKLSIGIIQLIVEHSRVS